MSIKKRVGDKSITTAKGVHTFSFCDGRSEKAKKLINECSSFELPRAIIIAKKEDALSPIRLRLNWLGIKIRELSIQGKRSGELEEEQTSLFYDYANYSENVKRKLDELKARYDNAIGYLHQEFKTREQVVENITTTVGRSVFAQRLGGDTTFTGTVNYTALGSDNTAATISDSLLGTETSRKALSTGADTSNQTILETFFALAEAIGTHEEYAMFIDGTASADTGQLFNRFVATTVKSGTETMNVQSVVTFNDA
jgi:hypothetical protein